MKSNLKYLWYVIRHKYYVGLACFKFRLYWQGLIHDWSKFLPSEWFPYVRYFYGDGKNKFDFDMAWLHHQKFNPHHWQYWILKEDDGNEKIMPMPHKYMLEMIADWKGAGKAITGKYETKEWYNKNKEHIMLHYSTKKFVEELLNEG